MKILLLTSFFTLFALNASFAQGKLDKAQQSLKKKDTSTSKKDANQHSISYESNNSNTDDYSSDFSSWLVEHSLLGTYYLLIGGRNENQRFNTLSKYPYLNLGLGNYSTKPNDSISTSSRSTISDRLIYESQNLLGNQLNFNFRFAKRWGMELNYLQFWENNFFDTSSFSTFSLLLKHYRIRSQKMDLHWGIGATYLGGFVNKIAFTYALGTEIFIKKPVSMEINFNQSFINDETVNTFNVLGNYYIKKTKLIVGWELQKIGSEQFSLFSAGVGFIF